MATTQDCVEFKYEETPRHEGAATTTPFQLSTAARYFPVQEAQIAPNPEFLDRQDELRGWEAAPEQLIQTYDPVGSLKMRAYLDDLIFLLGLNGWKGTYTAGAAGVRDANETTVTGVNALNSATINVASTADFPSSGSIVIAADTISYTGKTATSFTGCGAHAATAGGEVVNGNVPAGAAKWVFAKRGGRVAKTAQVTVAYADEGVWLREQGVGLPQLDINADGDVSASLSGLFFSVLSVDPNIAPTYPSAGIPPARRGDLTLSWLTGSGNTEDFSLSLMNPLAKRRSMTVKSYFPDKMEHDKQRVRVTGQIPKSTLEKVDVDALVAGTSFVAKAYWDVPKVIGATSYNYRAWIQMPKCQIVGGSPEAVSNARRFGGSYDFWAAYDETLGYDARITIVGSIVDTGVASAGIGL